MKKLPLLLAFLLPLFAVLLLRSVSSYPAAVLLAAAVSAGFASLIAYLHHRHRQPVPATSIAEYCAVATFSLLIYLAVI